MRYFQELNGSIFYFIGPSTVEWLHLFREVTLVLNKGLQQQESLEPKIFEKMEEWQYIMSSLLYKYKYRVSDFLL